MKRMLISVKAMETKMWESFKGLYDDSKATLKNYHCTDPGNGIIGKGNNKSNTLII